MINKYITTMAALTLSFGANAQTNTPEQKLPRPNVLFIVVDDLGWSDVGYNGSTMVATPNIDRLANMGVTFTDGYVTAPISGPSRNGMVSGMYSQRYGMFLKIIKPCPKLCMMPVTVQLLLVNGMYVVNRKQSSMRFISVLI